MCSRSVYDPFPHAFRVSAISTFNFGTLTALIVSSRGSLLLLHLSLDNVYGQQVFVANPKKPPQIESILRRNKEKLLNFLKSFHNDKEGTNVLRLTGFLVTFVLQMSSSAMKSNSLSFKFRTCNGAFTLTQPPRYIPISG